MEVFNPEEQDHSFQPRRGCFCTRTAAFLNSAGSCLLHLTFAAIAAKRESLLKLEVCMSIVTTGSNNNCLFTFAANQHDRWVDDTDSSSHILSKCSDYRNCFYF